MRVRRVHRQVAAIEHLQDGPAQHDAGAHRLAFKGHVVGVLGALAGRHLLRVEFVAQHCVRLLQVGQLRLKKEQGKKSEAKGEHLGGNE